MPAREHECERLSIIVLTYNRKRLLADCLKSLLAQTYSRDNLEIIVINDGSSDGTEQLAREVMSSHEHVRYFYQTHKGIPAARNHGITKASGAIIAIVADDYILAPDYAETIMTFFRRNPQAAVVRFKVVPSHINFGSRISHFYFDLSVRRRLYEAVHPAPPGLKDHIKRLLQKMPSLDEKVTTRHGLEAAGAAAFRREVFSKVGLFDESLKRAEDTDMTRRLTSAGVAVYYFPHHHIGHQYSPFLFDTIYKCFNTGFNRYKYYRKHGELAEHKYGLIKGILIMKLNFMLTVLWRARQTTSARECLLFLPFVVLFEVVNKLGFLSSWVLSKTWPKRRKSIGKIVNREQ